MAISTEVTDSANGRPAVGIPVRLDKREHGGWTSVAVAATGRDGCVADWMVDASVAIDRGTYRLVFDTNAYFAELGVAAFHPEITIVFVVSDPTENHRITLLIAPHAYTTYRAG